MSARYYTVWDEPTLALAAEHGCLDEDVHTGDPVVCADCADSIIRGGDDCG